MPFGANLLFVRDTRTAVTVGSVDLCELFCLRRAGTFTQAAHDPPVLALTRLAPKSWWMTSSFIVFWQMIGCSLCTRCFFTGCVDWNTALVNNSPSLPAFGNGRGITMRVLSVVGARRLVTGFLTHDAEYVLPWTKGWRGYELYIGKSSWGLESLLAKLSTKAKHGSALALRQEHVKICIFCNFEHNSLDLHAHHKLLI